LASAAAFCFAASSCLRFASASDLALASAAAFCFAASSCLCFASASALALASAAAFCFAASSCLRFASASALVLASAAAFCFAASSCLRFASASALAQPFFMSIIMFFSFGARNSWDVNKKRKIIYYLCAQRARSTTLSEAARSPPSK